ncbi:MAG: STAS domain-containing protein [Chromatiales bacterium]|jgi:anti-anti-sigma factor|nr:STAS domain-containing protein [Chromatiales bacterium]MDX9766945.1 STAS domain-containing protein [Ectothiorhodospiraceae bacterium]
MSIDVTYRERQPGLFELTLAGRLDTDTYAQVEATLDGIFANAVRGIQFDMRDLTYLSSMGLRVLIKTMKRLRPVRGTVTLTHLQPQIHKVIEIASVLPKENIFSSVEEADAYFDAMQSKVLGQDG